MALSVWAQGGLSAAIGAVIVFFTTVIAAQISPVPASIFWSIPFSLMSSIIAFYIANDDITLSYKLLYNSSATMAALVALMIVWGVVMQYYYEDDKRKRYWGSFGWGVLAWLVVTGIYAGIVYGIPNVKQTLY